MQRINSLGLAWTELRTWNMALWWEGHHAPDLHVYDAAPTLIDSRFVCTWYPGPNLYRT